MLIFLVLSNFDIHYFADEAWKKVFGNHKCRKRKLKNVHVTNGTKSTCPVRMYLHINIDN